MSSAVDSNQNVNLDSAQQIMTSQIHCFGDILNVSVTRFIQKIRSWKAKI